MRLKELLKPVGISLFFTVLFLHTFIFNLGSPVEFMRGDAWHVSFTLKHYMEILESGRFDQILNMRMFHGFENTLLYSEILFTQAVLAVPFYFLSGNIIFAYNAVCALTVFLNFLSMYLLVRYFTKQSLPANAVKQTLSSILGAIIFTFNPWNFAHFPDQLMHYSIYPMPLIILFFEKFLASPKGKYIFLIALFASIQLLSNMSYSGLLTMLLPIYFGFRVWQKRKEINFQFSITNFQSKFNFQSIIWAVAGVILFLSVAGGLGYLYASFYIAENVERTSIIDTTFFAPWVSDLFFTSSNNLIYGGLRDFSIVNFPEYTFRSLETAERNLFWGITVIVLFVLSFKYLPKTQFRNLWRVCLGLIVFCLVLSFGSVFRISENFAIPNIYGFFYDYHPLVHQLRVPSRFAIFIYLFLGLVCAITLSEILKKVKGQTALQVGILVVALVALEYMNKPLGVGEFKAEAKEVYAQLNQEQEIEVILELPMGNLFTPIRPAWDQFVDARYMLYAETLHNKRLLNGYSSYSPPLYIKRLEYLSVNFPNALKLKQIQEWGIDAVILHKDEFEQPGEYELIVRRMEDLEVPLLKSTENMSLFKIHAWKLAE